MLFRSEHNEQFGDAAKAYQRILEADPRNVVALHRLAVSLDRAGQSQDAAEVAHD